jgi:RHS repeat-associated protein
MTTVRYTTINGEVIAEKRNGSRRLYVPDPLGSTVALLDNTQTQVDTFTYWPYGEVRASTGTTQPPYQFVGTKGYYTDGVGRTYVRARYLHTPKGRWLTQDPIGLGSGDWNLYRYIGNMPVLTADASGLIDGTAAPGTPLQGPKLPPVPPGVRKDPKYLKCVGQCIAALIKCLEIPAADAACIVADVCCELTPNPVCCGVALACGGIDASKYITVIGFCFLKCIFDRQPVHCGDPDLPVPPSPQCQPQSNNT